MNMVKTILGTTYLPLKCKIEDLRKIINQSIDECEDHFSFNDLLNQIKPKVEFDKEPNTQYSTIDFIGTDLDFINGITWEQIWDRKLVIDLTNRRPIRDQEIFHFIKINTTT